MEMKNVGSKNRVVDETKLFSLIAMYNKGKNEYCKATSRVYYVAEGKNIVFQYDISKGHTLAESNKIAHSLFSLMFDDGYILEYTGMTIDKSYSINDFTGNNQYFEHNHYIFIA